LCNKVNGATTIGVILISFGKHVGGIALDYLLGRPISLFPLLRQRLGITWEAIHLGKKYYVIPLLKN
jgi:hypothetical protein